jgi:hypothetical protein
MKMHWRIVFGVALALTLALPTIGWTDGNDQVQPIPHAVVDFGQPPPQGAPASTTHFLQPVGGAKDGEVTIFKDGTVTFRVNGGGHGVSVYKVNKNTTRDDIIGATPEGLCPTRSGCTALPDFINAAHTLRDAGGNVVLEVGTNPPVARIDDASRILVGTTAIVSADRDLNGLPTDPGIFHQGANCSETEPPPPALPTCVVLRAQGLVARPIGEQIRVKFTKNGRYLVICMNRGHSINDHMFSFVNVVGDDDEN